MSEFVTDQDRVDLLKKWWAEYGNTLITGIILGLAIIYGWQYWQKHQAKLNTQASVEYQTLLAMSMDNNPQQFQTAADKLIKDYHQTPYASLASLLLAKQKVAGQNYSQALQNLNWVMKHGSNKSLKQMARIQSARIYLFQNKSQEALTALDKVNDKNFDVLTDEMRGDAYAAQGNIEQARNYYQKALKDNPDSDILIPLLNVKLNSLPAAK